MMNSCMWVCQYDPETSTGPAPTPPPSGLVVTKLSPLMPVDQVMRHFAAFGRIQEIDHKHDPKSGGALGICWVKYVEEATLDAGGRWKVKSGGQAGYLVAAEAQKRTDGAKIGNTVAMGGTAGVVRVQLDGDGSLAKRAVKYELDKKLKLRPSSSSSVDPNKAKPAAEAKRPASPIDRSKGKPETPAPPPTEKPRPVTPPAPSTTRPSSANSSRRGDPPPSAPRAMRASEGAWNRRWAGSSVSPEAARQPSRLQSFQPQLKQQTPRARVSRWDKGKTRAEDQNRPVESDSSEDSSDDDREKQAKADRDKVFFPRRAGPSSAERPFASAAGPATSPVDVKANERLEVQRRLHSNGKQHVVLSKQNLGAFGTEQSSTSISEHLRNHFAAFSPSEVNSLCKVHQTAC